MNSRLLDQQKGSVIYVMLVCLVAALGGLLFGYDTGVLQTKEFGGINWYAVDRKIDRNTGLVRESRDPAGHITEYTWDSLGRLREILSIGKRRGRR